MDLVRIILFLILTSLHGVTTLSDDDTRVYVWAFMNITTDNSGLPQFQQIFLSASVPTEFRLQIPQTGYNQYGYLRPGSKLTPQWREQTFVVDLSDDPSKLTAFSALRLTASNKIDIQASKVTRGSADSLLVLPLTAESTEFFIPSYDGLSIGHSSFLVVSPYEDTCVEASFVNGTDVRRIFFRSLREFEVYQAYSLTEDYTGVHIRASAPVAVFGGHECAQVPVGTKFCDHIVEQVPPVSEWGTDHVVGPIIGRAWQAGYMIRIVSGFTNTTVTCRKPDGSNLDTSVVLDRGNFKEYYVDDNRLTVYCWCSEKCLVAQYNTGYQSYDPNKDIKTDPWMTVVTPVDHFTNYMTFSTMKYWADYSTAPFTSFLTVIARTSAKDGIRLNQQPLPALLSWTDDVASSGYSSVAFAIHPGNYTLYHEDSTESFVGYVYGHSASINPAGYGYATGYKMKGSPLTERIWDELLTTAPPTVCSTPRTLPPATDRGPDMKYSLSVQLVNRAMSSECAYKYKLIVDEKIGDLKELINNLICVGVLCPQTSHTYLSELEVTQYKPSAELLQTLDSFVIEVQQPTSLDEVIGELIKCKRSVTAFIQQSYNWNLPLRVDGCPDLDITDTQLVRDQLQCVK